MSAKRAGLWRASRLHVAELVDHPLDFQLAGLVGFGLLLLGGLGVVGQGADGLGVGDDRPKYVAVCRESDLRGPLESIAARC